MLERVLRIALVLLTIVLFISDPILVIVTVLEDKKT
jgi:hypothetical protein